jgi:hypothetical protein
LSNTVYVARNGIVFWPLKVDWNLRVVKFVAEISPHSYIFSEMAYLTSNQYMA